MAREKPLVGVIGLERDVKSVSGTDIQVTCRFQLLDRVSRYGLVPIIISPRFVDRKEIVQHLDGLLIPGGGDIHPSLYGDTDLHPKLEWLDIERDKVEIHLIELALRRNIPILGICRGMQLLNVATGGTMHQHILDKPQISWNHYELKKWNKHVHPIRISSLSSILGKIFPEKEDVMVNSVHHQAIKDLGEGIAVTAVSTDGIIEGVESTRHDYVIGVQWHPELMEDDLQDRLFSNFANATFDVYTPRNKLRKNLFEG